MRALKILLIIAAALLALLVILSFLGPSTSVVERTVAINAPDSVIYPRIASLKTMHGWSAWAEVDRDQETQFVGADGTVGSKQDWVGDTVGTGSLEVLELVPHSHVGLDMRFIKPFKTQSKVDFDLVGDGKTTQVTERVTTKNGFIGRVAALFMDSDAMLGPMFEKGLNNLKGQAEAIHQEAQASLDARTVNGHVISRIAWPETVYVGKRNKRVKWTDLDKFYGESYGAAGAALGAANLEPGVPSAVFFEWNEVQKTADVLAGFPVKAAAGVQVPGMDVYVVPQGRMLHIAYRGSYEGSMSAHEAMDKYIKANNQTHHSNVIEEYVTGPGQEADTAKWLTHIYYMVR